MDDRGDDNIGRNAGWGSPEDQASRPAPEEAQGPSMLAFTRGWGRTLGCFWLPGIALLITVEDWLHVPQVAGWLSLVGLLVVFLAIWWWLDRRRT